VIDTRLSPLRLSQRNRHLDNGLRVVVHEDRTSPIVAVHLMYHVGSRNEKPGRTGLAHLLEHLLFEGSQNCPKGEFDRLLDRVGGTNNGSTWLDRTNYYEVVPTHAVELALWLERERMAHFLPVLDDAMLELQRGVVMNERRQTCENRPYGLADERLHELLFPAHHPYSWPTIGYMRDLEAMRLDDARDFFQHHYTPRNAVLVLAGDLSADEGFRLAEKYFADLPSGPEPPASTNGAIGEERTAHRSETMEDRVTLPRLYQAYSVAPYGTADWVALDVLTYLLSDGESSRLQRRMVREQQIALDVDTYLYPTELNGVLGMVATARSGVGGDALRGAFEEVVREVAEGWMEEVEVSGAIMRARRDQLSSLATVEERAEELAYATTVLGRPEALDELLAGYASVGPDEVRDAARRYLTKMDSASVVVVPRPGSLAEVAE
jgi:zinc protease